MREQRAESKRCPAEGGVLKNFKQVIWTIEELVNQANQRLGGLSGKLVYHKYGEKINCDQEILIPRAHHRMLNPTSDKIPSINWQQSIILQDWSH